MMRDAVLVLLGALWPVWLAVLLVFLGLIRDAVSRGPGRLRTPRNVSPWGCPPSASELECGVSGTPCGDGPVIYRMILDDGSGEEDCPRCRERSREYLETLSVVRAKRALPRDLGLAYCQDCGEPYQVIAGP